MIDLAFVRSRRCDKSQNLINNHLFTKFCNPASLFFKAVLKK